MFLNVSNTNVHIIYDYPGVVDFKMENTPSIEFRDAVENISLNNSKMEKPGRGNENKTKLY